MDSLDLELSQIRDALAERQDVAVVHYSCESFNDAKSRPPAIAAIAIYDLKLSTVTCYSRADAPPSRSDEAELDLLREFYADITNRADAQLLHWNMDRPEFGFDALAKRFRYLTDGKETAPNITTAARRYDVDELISIQFGENYAPHGKLESTAKMNRLDMRSFKNGLTESELFRSNDWATIARSTSSKAMIIGQLAQRLIDGTIKTAHSAGMVRFADSRLDAVAVVLDLGQRYLIVRRSLSKHPHGREPVKFENEWDDQYVFRSMLALFFDDIRDEDPVQVTAGSGSRIDFVLADYQLAIELKHTRSSLEDKDLGVQLLVDASRYASRSDITHLVCLVFDYDGLIRNPRSIEKDLSKSQSQPGLTVTVKIFDR
jgi:REase_DpnII-MboI